MPGNKQEHKYWGMIARTFQGDTLYVVGHGVYQEVRRWLP